MDWVTVVMARPWVVVVVAALVADAVVEGTSALVADAVEGTSVLAALPAPSSLCWAVGVSRDNGRVLQI